jgi:hypothetical protein
MMKLLPLIAISFFTFSALAAPAEPPTTGNRAASREPYVDIRARAHRRSPPDSRIDIRSIAVDIADALKAPKL